MAKTRTAKPMKLTGEIIKLEKSGTGHSHLDELWPATRAVEEARRVVTISLGGHGLLTLRLREPGTKKLKIGDAINIAINEISDDAQLRPMKKENSVWSVNADWDFRTVNRKRSPRGGARGRKGR